MIVRSETPSLLQTITRERERERERETMQSLLAVSARVEAV